MTLLIADGEDITRLPLSSPLTKLGRHVLRGLTDRILLVA
jgi:hypothetical protein